MLMVHLPCTSCQPCSYAAATIAQMVSKLHLRKGMSSTKTGLLRPTAGGGEEGLRPFAYVLAIL
jgi:hypothetical protein